jgi:iron complex outermembrane receptor protein
MEHLVPLRFRCLAGSAAAVTIQRDRTQPSVSRLERSRGDSDRCGRGPHRPRLILHAAAYGLVPLIGALIATAPSSAAQGPTVELPEVRVGASRSTPLDNDAPAESGSFLGLKAREMPASIEILDRERMQSQGIRSVTEAAQAATGVLAADFPAEPAAFSMRGYTNSQINILYNGIRLGPQNMTSRVMETGNLERIEILRGPASLMSGEGAVGGAINFVTRRPHNGTSETESHFSIGSFGTVRGSVGSGGSTALPGLDYRVDLSRTSSDGHVDDTGSRNGHLSAGLDYRVLPQLKLWTALEYKFDRGSPYWGTPLVPLATAGANASGGIVSGTYVSNYNGTDLGAVTIDGRTRKTNYNVRDSRNEAEEYFLRGGLEWTLRAGVALRNQTYYYTAKREWFNNEIVAFNAASGLVDRERFYVAHDQTLTGNKSELQFDGRIAGMPNRAVFVLDASKLDFERPGAGNFPGDAVSLLEPARGTYGPLTLRRQGTNIRTIAFAAEDRLQLSPGIAFIGGLRHESIALDRSHVNPDGSARPGFPFSKTFRPTTGRTGLVVDPAPGLTLYAQYATGADVAANNSFLLGPAQPLELTRSRAYEAGLKQLFWEKRGEVQAALFDIARSNVYAAAGGRALNVAGEQRSRGTELALGLRPDRWWTLRGNLAYTNAEYRNYTFAGGSYSGNTPPNVPKIVANAEVIYRTATSWPVEIGTSLRHVGERYHSDANTVKLLAYTVADAFVAVDLPKARIAFRVRNLTDEKYAAWSDPFYPDQILLGAPRSYEITASLRF